MSTDMVHSMYVNRDSIKYIELYGLEGIETMIRGHFEEITIVKHGLYWYLGLTDNTTKLSLSGQLPIFNTSIHGF